MKDIFLIPDLHIQAWRSRCGWLGNHQLYHRGQHWWNCCPFLQQICSQTKMELSDEFKWSLDRFILF